MLKKTQVTLKLRFMLLAQHNPAIWVRYLRYGNIFICCSQYYRSKAIGRAEPGRWIFIWPGAPWCSAATAYAIYHGLHSSRHQRTTRQLVSCQNTDKWSANQVDMRSTCWDASPAKTNSSFYRAMLCIRGTSHGTVFYRNGWTNRGGFWHVSFLLTVLHCVERKFGYLPK